MIISAILDAVHHMCDEWGHKGRWQGLQVCFNWVSGHDSIWGNEKTDAEVKRAISEGSSPWLSLPEILQLTNCLVLPKFGSVQFGPLFF